jgi:Fur family transcriptional regulator, zinc uptake regulator
MTEELLLQKLRDKGYKITPQRRVILEALLQSEHPTALEVLACVRNVFPEMSLDTVYRNLNMLTDVGITNLVNLRGGEAIRFEMERGKHHHHLVCLKCGTAVCLDYCPIDDKDQRAAEKHGFKLVGHAVELYGYCRECS